MAQRSVASDITIGLGLASMRVDVVNQFIPNLKKAASTKGICPTCIKDDEVGAVGVVQKYHCTHDDKHGPFGELELERAREIDGELVHVTAEEIAALAGDVDEDEKKSMTLHVWPAADVDACFRPGESGYRLRPSKKQPKAAKEFYGLMLAAARRTDLALVAEFASRSVEKVYRLNVWTDAEGRSQLCMTEMVRPDDLMPLDDIDVLEADERSAAQFDALLDVFTEEFDPAVIRNTRRERAAALDAAKANGEAQPAPALVAAPTPAPAGDDLAALLEAAIASRRAA